MRDQGLDAARARFADSGVAIEAATLAAAAHEDDALDLDQVIDVLTCEIDSYVFYAPFLELMVSLGRDEMGRAVKIYEQFVARTPARSPRFRTARPASVRCATAWRMSTSARA